MFTYREYWQTMFRLMAAEPDYPLSPQKTTDKNWLAWNCFGRSGSTLFASAHQKDGWISVNFATDKLRTDLFCALLEDREKIDAAIGATLRWGNPIGKEKSGTQAILTKYGVDHHDRSAWPDQHQWFVSQLSCFYKAFRQAIDKFS